MITNRLNSRFLFYPILPARGRREVYEGLIKLSEGLRPHHHQFFEYETKVYYDKQTSCIVKKVTLMCMICGKLKYEKYETYQPPPKSRGNRSLEKNKKKYGNR